MPKPNHCRPWQRMDMSISRHIQPCQGLVLLQCRCGPGCLPQPPSATIAQKPTMSPRARLARPRHSRLLCPATCKERELLLRPNEPWQHGKISCHKKGCVKPPALCSEQELHPGDAICRCFSMPNHCFKPGPFPSPPRFTDTPNC